MSLWRSFRYNTENFFIPLAILFLFSAASAAAGETKYWTRIYKIEFEGKNYSIGLIEPIYDPETLPRGSVVDSAESLRILDKVQDWILRQYARNNRFEKYTDLYMELRTTESLLDGRSSIIFISEYNNIHRILATLRISTVGVHQERRLLPLEKRLKIRLPRPTPEWIVSLSNNERNLVLPRSFPSDYLVRYPYGAVAELKNFVKFNSDTMPDFVPLLLEVFELSGMSINGGPIPPELRDVVGGFQIREPSRERSRDFHLNVKVPLFSKRRGFSQIVPSRYVLETDEPMLKYYERLGFYVIEQHGFTYVMAISRPDFATHIDGLAQTRGLSTFDKLKWLEDFRWKFRDVSCQNLLEHPERFFIDITWINFKTDSFV